MKTIEWPDGGRYEGAVNEGGWPHGQGVETTPDGARYEGAFRDGLPHGQGVLTFPDGARYEGAHQVGSSVEQAYARSDLFARRAQVMERWGRHVAGAA